MSTMVLPLKQKPYTLLTKELGINTKNPKRYFPEMLSLTEPESADVVIIAKSDDLNKKTIITTFRDKNKEMIERVYEYEGMNKPETHRIYKPLSNHGYKYLKGKLIQVFENLDITNKFKVWKKISSEKQYVERDINDNICNVTIAKVTTKERDVRPTTEESHSLTEYFVPSAYNGQKHDPRYIQFETTKEKGIPKITSIKTSEDVDIPQYDNYLAMRIYDSDDIKVPITKTALKENGLEGLDIPVEDSYTLKDTTIGCFTNSTGIIHFNYKKDDKPEMIETGFHEAKHAFQYAILGILNKIKSSFTTKCLEKFKGEITDSIRRLGDKYHEGHKNYAKAEENYREYRKNILEDEAWQYGEEKLKEYAQKGRALSEQFLGIPAQEL